jgi:hypothetical protein
VEFAKTSGFDSIRFSLSVVVGLFVLLVVRATAQNPGNNAVWSSPTMVVASSSFVDASVLPDTATSHDICERINAALWTLLQPPYGGAGVIDARGINTSNTFSAGGALPCSHSPWSNSWTHTFSVFPNAVVLLPAGTIGLQANANWVLPDRTRIIGVGSGANGTSITTIQAGSGFTGTMIQMGATTGLSSCPLINGTNICSGVAVEDLRLDGGGLGVIGIANAQSQELSYVNRVTFYRVRGTGLLVGGGTSGGSGAQNSGPYTNIRFEYPSGTPTSSTLCAWISGAPTRGIHGLTCSNSTATLPSVAVNVDSNNNSIEDIYISGFADGIDIGSNANAQGNVLLNITGNISSP